VDRNLASRLSTAAPLDDRSGGSQTPTGGRWDLGR